MMNHQFAISDIYSLFDNKKTFSRFILILKTNFKRKSSLEKANEHLMI